MKGKSGKDGEKGKKKGENKSDEGESRRLMQMAKTTTNKTKASRT